MPATPHDDIESAIMNRIKTTWALTAVHYPATKFAVNPAAAYIQPRVVFIAAEQAALGAAAENRIRGNVRTMIFTPVGLGSKPARQHADKFTNDLFKRGLILPTAGKAITFETPEVEGSIEDEEWYQLPVVCPFYSDVPPA